VFANPVNSPTLQLVASVLQLQKAVDIKLGMCLSLGWCCLWKIILLGMPFSDQTYQALSFPNGHINDKGIFKLLLCLELLSQQETYLNFIDLLPLHCHCM